MSESSDEEFFEISAVSRITGLSTHVLRIWEKRYAVVEPIRSDTMRRLYSKDDVHRLTLLKSLVDNGHTISSVANLNRETLEQRLADILGTKIDSGLNEVHRVGFAGVLSRKAVRDAGDCDPAFKLTSDYSRLDELVKNVKAGTLEILIVEVDSLFEEDLAGITKALDALNIPKAVVIYQFAGSQVFESPLIGRISTLCAPVTSAEILLTCTPSKSDSPRVDHELNFRADEIPPRIFTGEQLAVLKNTTSAIKCECPNHLGKLLAGLNAFEEYSSRCENATPEDAKMHAFLHLETAQCRFRLEQALVQLLDAEGIKI